MRGAYRWIKEFLIDQDGKVVAAIQVAKDCEADDDGDALYWRVYALRPTRASEFGETKRITKGRELAEIQDDILDAFISKSRPIDDGWVPMTTGWKNCDGVMLGRKLPDEYAGTKIGDTDGRR